MLHTLPSHMETIPNSMEIIPNSNRQNASSGVITCDSWLQPKSGLNDFQPQPTDCEVGGARCDIAAAISVAPVFLRSFAPGSVQQRNHAE